MYFQCACFISVEPVHRVFPLPSTPSTAFSNGARSGRSYRSSMPFAGRSPSNWIHIVAPVTPPPCPTDRSLGLQRIIFVGALELIYPLTLHLCLILKGYVPGVCTTFEIFLQMGVCSMFIFGVSMHGSNIGKGSGSSPLHAKASDEELQLSGRFKRCTI